MNIYYVPKIDRLAGIQCYCTDFDGICGFIKQNGTTFRVSEMIDDSFLTDLSLVHNDTHKFSLYILDKRNIDSNHAIFEIRKELGIRLKILGIKDSKAITKQYASSEQIRNIRREEKTQHTSLVLKGFSRKPLRKAYLSGNEFAITVNNVKSSNISDFIPQIRNIANFYGLQRFGSKRLITHLVGREIVKRNFKKAIEVLLSYTTEYDSSRAREIREKCRDPKNYSQILKQLPKGMDIEYEVISALVNGREPVAALRSIPIVIRRLFVQAYQAYIFNNCLSTAILDGENISACKEGDLCFEMKGQLIFGKIRKYDSHAELASDVVPAVPV